jgi:hypothetical protein
MSADEHRPDVGPGGQPTDGDDTEEQLADSIEEADPGSPAQGAVTTDDDRELPEPNEPG